MSVNIRFKGIVNTLANIAADKFAGRFAWATDLARAIMYYDATNYGEMARRDVLETFSAGIKDSTLSTPGQVVTVGTAGRLTGVAIGSIAAQTLTPTAAITSNYSAAVGEFVLCNISGGSFTVTLPAAPVDKSIIKVQIVKDGSQHSLTIQAGGSDTIGATLLAGGTTMVYGNLVFETATLQYQASVGVWRIEITAAPQNFAIGFPGIDAATPITANDISIDYATRVITITPPLGYFNIFVDGNGLITKFRKDGNISFPAFTDTSGVWYFYFDTTGAAITTQTVWGDFDIICPVYRILWNATLTPDATKSQVENFEGHLNTISAADHTWKHTYGTIWVRGLDVTDNRLASGSPNADGRNTVIGLSTGTNIDDNLVYTITNSTSSSKWNQDLGSNVAGSLTSSNSAQMKIRTQTGAGLTVMLDATRFPFAWNSVNNKPQYITSTGTRTDVANNFYFVMYVYATPDPRVGNTVRLSSAISEYSSLTLAQASTWADQQSTFATLNDKEIRPLYKLIFEHKTTYDAATKYSVLRQVDDIRKAVVTSTMSIPGTIPATSVAFTPYDGIASTNVQSALQELADERVSLSGVAGGQTVNGGTLTAENLNLRGNATDLTTGQVNVLSSLDASSKTVASLTTAGGLGVAKKSHFGDTIASTAANDASVGTEELPTSDSGPVATNNWSGTNWATVTNFTQKTTGTIADVTVAATGKTFTRVSGSFLTDGFAVGQIVAWTGFANAGNNISTFAISAVTATVMTFSAATGLVNEAAGASVTCSLATCTISNVAVNATNKTYTRTAGSWITDGFAVGMVPEITGFANAGNNVSTFAISTLTATVMTLTAATGLVTETVGAQATFVPYVLKHTSAGANALTLAGYAATAAQAYLVTFSAITTTLGTLTPRYGGTNANSALGQVTGSATGHQVVITAANTDGLIFTPNAAWVGYLYGFSIKTLTAASSAFNAITNAGVVSISMVSGTGSSFGIGSNALKYIITGTANNLAIGNSALSSLTTTNGVTALGNTAVGGLCLRDNTTGYQNLAVSANALRNNVSGYYNVGLGGSALSLNVNGYENVAIGGGSLQVHTAGYQSTAIGRSALAALTSGNLNTAIGYNAATASQATSYATAIGAWAFGTSGAGGLLSNCVALGYSAGRYNTTINKLYIDAFDRVNTAGDDAGAIITGTFDATPANQTLKFNAATTVSNTLTATQFKLSGLNTAPSSASDTGALGEIRIASGYIYVCVATNTWQRSQLATW